MTPLQLIGIALAVLLVASFMAIAFLERSVRGLKSQVTAAEEKAKRDLADREREYEEEKQRLLEQHVADLEKLRREHERDLQMVKEKIEGRREILQQRSEKELLVDTVMALETYGSRIQRLETILDSEGFAERIDRLSDEFSGRMSDVSKSVNAQIAELARSVEESVESLDIALATQRLEDLDDRITEMHDAVDGMKSAIGDGYEPISEKLASVSYDIDSIKSSIGDPYEFDSLRYAIEEAKSMASDAKDAAEEARDAADSARYAAESHL